MSMGVGMQDAIVAGIGDPGGARPAQLEWASLSAGINDPGYNAPTKDAARKHARLT